jgi:hypothetical protein
MSEGNPLALVVDDEVQIRRFLAGSGPIVTRDHRLRTTCARRAHVPHAAAASLPLTGNALITPQRPHR